MSKLFEMICETDRWQRAIDIANDKEIDAMTIKYLCYPEQRNKILDAIAKNKYRIFPPSIAKIPKDKPGEFREVYVNIPQDRILLSIINECLCELFADLIHPKCVSYKRGTSTQMVIQKISNEIINLSHYQRRIGVKADFSKYFDTVKIEVIDDVFDSLEKALGYGKNTEPVLNVLRRYYHSDLFFDVKGNVNYQYQGLKQGCAVASFLANIVLYELDEYMSKKYKIYYRYSDDVVVIDKNTNDVLDEMNSIISKYGVKLNPKKVEPLYHDEWFKFLGFNLKGNLVTLSSSRINKFKKEIRKLTVNDKNSNLKKARKQVLRYMYQGQYSWASSCLGVINVDKDIYELNKFVMDCIRACETKRKRVGGIGSSLEHGEVTVLRGKGRNVRTNRDKIPVIEDYNTIMCMKKVMTYGRAVYETIVRTMLL